MLVGLWAGPARENGPRAEPWAAPSARSTVVARPVPARSGPIGLRAVPTRPVVHLYARVPCSLIYYEKK